MIPSQEIEFITFLTLSIISFQLSIYFFYQYFKLKKRNLYFNSKLQLSFGIFLLLLITGICFLNNVRLFQTDVIVILLFSKLGWLLIFLAPLGFLFCVLNQQFHEILDIKTTQILILFNSIAPVLLFLSPSTDTLLFRASIVLMIPSLIYIIYIQLNIIKKTKGQLKKRIILFLSGEIVAFSSLVNALLVNLSLIPEWSNVFYYSGLGILFCGLLLIIISLINSPPFYGLNYQQNLLKFYVINNNNKKCFYFVDFQRAFSEDSYLSTVSIKNVRSIDKALFSKVITGIELMIGDLTNTKGEKITQIQQENSMLIFDHSTTYEDISYILVVKNDVQPYYSFLQQLKRQFELFFKEILISLEKIKTNPEKLFRSFDMIIAWLLR